MSSIVIQGDTSGAITVEAPSVAGTHTLTLPKATGNIATDATVGLGMKNRIINGGMVIDQRNAGASVTLNSSQQYTVDRWFAVEDTDGTMTIQQSSTAPANFTKSVVVTTGTADASLGATQMCYVAQKTEGYNVADFGWGTANAKTVTLSFWVRSSLTGTFGGAISNGAFNRGYPFTYTISSANTWEQKSITITGDTTGTWSTDNTASMQIFWGLGVGSTYSGTAGSWAAAGYVSATGATSVVGTSGATWYLTGVQLEVGENATPFEYRMYGTELALCQRYFEKYDSMFGMPMHCFNTNTAYGNLSFKTVKRAAPTVSHGSPYTLYSGGSPKSISAVNFGTAGNKLYSVNIGVTTSVTLTAGQAGHFDIDSYLWIDSEL